eukprot:INCI7519.1.p1 GENE.INCI7519.1~~INCI7519.1.p1  ORF type:complete len:267 (+),score=37.12 INCI7519.1:163-963(+)
MLSSTLAIALKRGGASLVLAKSALPTGVAARCMGASAQVDVDAFRSPKIGVMAGSTRDGSVNRKLAAFASRVCKGMGAETQFIALEEFDLPIYSEATEAAGFPNGATELKASLESCDGWIIASPEYNGSITPLLLNAFTWASRGDPMGGPMYATFKGKHAVVMGASPGALGGLRAMSGHRDLLHNLGAIVLPNSVAVGGAFQAFDDDGALVNEQQLHMLNAACRALVDAARVEANRPATCDLVQTLLRSHVPGEYGTVTVAERGHA